ncbi:TadE/TadG family type IV pilus assembly protein [Caballeronia sp.]|uniref:TadE/TadG family type IV pilus assembly protein n=1 Tax=Caballeronia sp. TaxID=1931223 RepID=UPI003C38E504
MTCIHIPTRRLAHALRRAASRARHGLRRDDGVAGIELAVILPVVLLCLLGFTEAYLYIRAAAAVERTAFTLADTLGQKSSVIDIDTTASANNIGAYWNAGDLIAEPLDMDHVGEIIITSVCDTNSNNCATPGAVGTPGVAGTPKILWQRQSPADGTQNPNLKSELGAGITPSGWPFHSGDSMLAVEVFYTFNPFTMTSNFWPGAPGTQVIYEVAYTRPRWDKPVVITAS